MQWQKWAGQIPSVVLLFGDQLDDASVFHMRCMDLVSYLVLTCFKACCNT